MEKLQIGNPSLSFKAYLMVIKPGIIMGNAITAIGGFALASRFKFDFWILFAMLEGLSLIIASACILNNYIDREADKKMKRTQNRAFVKGTISPLGAMIYAAALGLLGTFILGGFTNLMTLITALVGFFIYVFIYTPLKYRTTHATLIGSLAGAVPPVVGYTSVTNQFDLAALILFGIVLMWQMPHFFAIALYRLEDYAAASIPVLPIKKGIRSTKIQMVIYIVFYTVTSSLLTLFWFTGLTYLIISTFTGLIWLVIGLSGFKSLPNQNWARQMFIFSLIAIMVFAMIIPFSVL